MDVIVGLPTTTSGYDSILTVTDKLTKRVHLIPLKYGKAGGAEVARLFFDNIWRLHSKTFCLGVIQPAAIFAFSLLLASP